MKIMDSEVREMLEQCMTVRHIREALEGADPDVVQRNPARTVSRLSQITSIRVDDLTHRQSLLRVMTIPVISSKDHSRNEEDTEQLEDDEMIYVIRQY